MPGELTRDAGLSAEEEISRDMNSVIDRLQQEISIRFIRLKKSKQQIWIFTRRQNSFC